MNAKKIAAVALLSTVVALMACRREVSYEPMKLGADVAPAEQSAR